MQTLNSVQLLRALASIAVVIHHAAVLYALPKYGNAATFGGYLELGQYGVDLFFVISGFIIATAHWNDIGKPSEIGRYVNRRFTRIFPIYWLFLIGTIMLIVAGIAYRDVPLSASNLIQSFTLVRLSGETLPLTVAWTLFHELLFYAIFGVLILSRRVGFVLLLCWTALILANFTLAGPRNTSSFQVVTDLINLEFLAGIGVFLFLKRIQPTASLAYALAGAGVLAVVAVALVHDGLLQRTVYETRALYGISFGLLIAGLIMLERLGRITIAGSLVFLGNASFTLYLVHGPFISFTWQILNKLGLLTAVPGEIYVVGVSIAAIAVASLLYVLVEQPLLAMTRSALRSLSASRAHFRPT